MVLAASVTAYQERHAVFATSLSLAKTLVEHKATSDIFLLVSFFFPGVFLFLDSRVVEICPVTTD